MIDKYTKNTVNDREADRQRGVTKIPLITLKGKLLYDEQGKLKETEDCIWFEVEVNGHFFTEIFSKFTCWYKEGSNEIQVHESVARYRGYLNEESKKSIHARSK